MIIHGDLKYKVELGDSPHGNMVRIENAIKNLEDRMVTVEDNIDNHKRNLENSKIEYDKPFAYEEEYKNKLDRQFELNQELDLGRNDEEVIEEDDNDKNNEVDMEEELEFS